MASHSSPAANDSSPDTPIWKMPSLYPPCILAAGELGPIVISQMGHETHHRGKQTVVRVLESPTRIRHEHLMVIIEDEEGTPAYLQLLHQPRETAVPAEKILRPGGCYLIKEPFLTVATNGIYSLRVDHPSDILLLPHGNDLLPAKWSNNNAAVGNSRDTRMNGNNAVREKRWAEAEDLYTTAVRLAETAEESQLAYLNRSLANLRLGRPATALGDAIKSYGGDSSARTEKGLCREASALYELAKYTQCLERLHELEAAYPGSSSAKAMTKRVHERLHEQRSGQYDFRRMYQQAESTPPLIDCATYTGAVEIRESPGKGHGVFTTRKVLAGELLICEKAFGYACDDNAIPVSKDMIERDISSKFLRTQILQKMLHNIEAARCFGDLHHGDYDAVSVYEVDGRSVVDSFLVKRVIELAGLGVPRTSLSSKRDLLSKGGDWQYNNVGVWCFISHFNHSCISNISSSFIGDMQIVRAARDIEEGSELFVCYQSPCELDSYEEAQERLRRWDFTCDCALCLDRKATPKDELMQRKALKQSIMDIMRSQSQEMGIPNAAQKMLERFEQTYSATAKIPGAVRLELWAYYYNFGIKLLAVKRPSEAIEMILKGLESLGFVISASPPRGRPDSSKPELLIRQWGMVIPFSADAFVTLHRAYRRVAPRLSVAAKTYAEVVYTMIMGEKETIVDSFPDMA